VIDVIFCARLRSRLSDELHRQAQQGALVKITIRSQPSRCIQSFLLLIVLTSLTGCSMLRPKIEPIRLMITTVAMTSPDMFNQRFMVHMHVENPNDREIAINGVDYKLFLQGDGFAEGLANVHFKLPAKGEQDVNLPVSTAFASSFARLISRLGGSKRLEYVMEGTMMTDISMLKKVPFRESGTAELSVLR
jgi:LEA14-like dessication related protein